MNFSPAVIVVFGTDATQNASTDAMSTTDRRLRDSTGPSWGRGGGSGVACLLGAIFLMVLPRGISAQRTSPDGSTSKPLRSAGDGAKFRVLERVPEAAKRSESVESPAESRISDELQGALRRGAWKRATNILDARIGELDPALEFLRAALWYRRDEYERAFQEFRTLQNSLPVLSDYAAYFTAASARELGHHHRAVLHAAKVPKNSRLHPDALFVLASSLFEFETQADRERGRKVVRRYLERYSDGAYAAELRLRLGERELEDQNWGGAAQKLFAILRNHPLSDEAERAQTLLEKHRSQFGSDVRKKITEPPATLRTAHYRALFNEHRSEEVVKGLKGELENWTRGSRGRCRALYWIGKSHSKLREHGAAAEWYEKILEHCRGVAPYEKKALYLAGKSYWNTDERSRALERFEELWTEFPDHSFADDAMYFAARIYRELGREGDATDLLERQIERYPNGDMADDAHWLRVRRWIDRESWRDVVDYVGELETADSNEPGSRGRLRYFQARAQERLGDREAANETYLQVASEHPLSYYALLAINRLADIHGLSSERAGCEKRRPPFCEELPLGPERSTPTVGKLPPSVRRVGPYKKGRVLLSVGLREWAGDEFERLFRRYTHRPEILLGLADLLDRASVHAVSHEIPDQVEGWSERYPAEANRRVWEIAYPRGFSSAVVRWSKRRALSASLIWSIIRRESGFEPGVESWANARGLMQLMWGTAQEIAREEGVEVTKSQLLRPNRNIRLGTAYLADLSKRLGDHPALLASGYNGGYANTSSWLESRGSLPVDLWVEEIPYGQTRKYVKATLAHYATYSWLYRNRRIPHIAFDFESE